jgi:peptidoglycan/LPS O-acetylase OafA/YrhL
MASSVATSKGYLPYRSELDGMRGLGLLTVMYHHSFAFMSGPDYRGGFLALDTFFVLSGYLITTLLIREWDKYDSISIKNFYARRGLRLLPALLLTIPFGWFVVSIVDQPFPRPYWQSAAAAVSYVANWFQIDKTLQPLGHTWTLSVEEQYYLVWSAFLFIAFRRGVSKRGLATLALVGAAGMGVLRLIAFQALGPNFAVLSTFTRPDGVLIGSALALLLADVPDRVREFLARRDVGLVSAALVVTGTFVLNWHTLPYHAGGLSVFNLVTAVLVSHMLLATSSLPRRMLSFRPFAALGRISYGVYLYHVPMLYLVIGHPAKRVGAGWVGIFFAASIGAGVASWYLVERPVLKLKSRFGSMSKMPELVAATAELPPD